MFKKLLILLILILTVTPCFGTDYYIDTEWTGTEAGTFTQPWNNVNDFTPTQGNHYRFKCGGDLTVSSSWMISAGGADADNYMIIGAYHDSNNTAAGVESTGTPDHEDDSPTFGSLCGNGHAKPIIRATTATPTEALRANGQGNQYIEFNSLSVRDGASTSSVFIKGHYVKVRYCYITNDNFSGNNSHYGIRVENDVYGNYCLIEYNLIDLAETSDNGDTVDGIELANGAQYCTVQYNSIGNYDHSGILASKGDYNTIQYNYFFDTGTVTSAECFNHNVDADHNIWRYNYCDDGGMVQISGGSYNEVYGNVINGAPKLNSTVGILSLSPHCGSTGQVTDNKVYNNVFYNSPGRGYNTYTCASCCSGSPPTVGLVERNQVYNNVFLTTTSFCFSVVDESGDVESDSGDPDHNKYYNNSFYNCGSTYGRVLDPYGSPVTYADADELNARGDCSGNRDDDPGVEDAVNGQFWAASESSNIIDNGYDVSATVSYLLNLTSDFTTSPPNVDLLGQSAPFPIGAYGFEGDPPSPTTPLGGTSLTGSKYN